VLKGLGREPPTYASAEEAAIGDIPPSLARVVAKCEWNGYAVVLLETNDGPPFEPYHVVCAHTGKGWEWVAGSNGSGWTPLPGKQTGVFALWEEEQEGSTVRIRYREAEHEVPVVDGYFLFCAWDVPGEPEADWPQLVE
jgi:hypothetical protein